MTKKIGLLGMALAMHVWGQAPTQWTVFRDLSAPFNGMLSDGDRMLTVGYHGLIATSGDGVGWSQIPSGCGATLYGILKAGSGYLAYGDSGVVLTSPDGNAWTRRSTPASSSTFQWGAYGNGSYVLIDWNNRLITSKDGISWTAVSAGLTGKQGFFRDFAFGAGRFLIVGDKSLQESADGAVWTDRSSSQSLYFSSIVRGDSVFMATTTSGIYKSADGLDWSSVKIGNFASVKLQYSSRGYLLAGPAGMVGMSPDGVTWTTGFAGTENHSLIAVAKGGFAAAGTDLATSANGSDWIVRKFGDHYSLNAGAYGNGRFVAVGDWSGMQISPDGTLWTTVAKRASGFFKTVIFAQDLFVAMGEAGKFATSPDGDTWATDSVATTHNLSDVANGPAGMVAVAYNWPTPSQGSIWGSPDGKAWSNLVPQASVYRGIAFGNGRYVAVGFAGVMGWSTDGKTWNNAAPLAKSKDFTDIAFGNGLFAAVGMDGAIATSPDGAAWTERTTETKDAMHAVIHNGNQFIAIGGSDVLSVSTDGITWIKGKSLQGVGTAIAYGGGRHIMISGYSIASSGDALITAGIRSGAQPRMGAKSGKYLEARAEAWLELPLSWTGNAATVRLRDLGGRFDRNLPVSGARAAKVSLAGVAPGFYLLESSRNGGKAPMVLRVMP
ncbi:MAG: hypothetical protein ABI036_12805 [Fibrobacteria bacterium]